MKKTPLRVSGVPEHFNFPWHLLYEQQLETKEKLKFKWTDDPSGTGSLSKRLGHAQIDVAILLLEGAIKNHALGEGFKIISFYVDSPLIWGVHANPHASFDSKGLSPRFAISRYSSGSHLMAFLYAQQKNMTLTEDAFVEVNHLKGAVQALSRESRLLFLWEKFTTQPWVNHGMLQRVDEYPTPWPAFVVAVRNGVLDQQADHVLRLVKRVQQQARELRKEPELPKMIADRYGLSLTDSQNWLQTVEWSSSMHIDHSILQKTIDILQGLDLLNQKPAIDNLLFSTQPAPTSN